VHRSKQVAFAEVTKTQLEELKTVATETAFHEANAGADLTNLQVQMQHTNARLDILASRRPSQTAVGMNDLPSDISATTPNRREDQEVNANHLGGATSTALISTSNESSRDIAELKVLMSQMNLKLDSARTVPHQIEMTGDIQETNLSNTVKLDSPIILLYVFPTRYRFHID
jgi:hypothetical protein